MPRNFVGMDIGDEMVNLAYRSQGGVTFVSRVLPDNAMSEGSVVSPQVLSEFLRGLRNEEHIRPKDCSLVLHPSNEYFRHATLPPLSEAELRLNLPYEFRDFITDDPESYSFDYALDKVDTDAEGETTGIEVFAAAARKDLVEQTATVLKRAGFRLKVVNPSPMAYMTLLGEHVRRHPEDAASSLALVDVGYTRMAVLLFSGAHYEGSRLVDMGVADVDKAIAGEKGIDVHVAASYRARDFEGVLEGQACAQVYDRMAFEVSKVLNFYNFSNQADVERAYLMGAGVTVSPLVTAMTDGLDVPVLPSTDLMGEGFAGNPNAAVCGRAYAGLLCGEASVHGA